MVISAEKMQMFLYSSYFILLLVVAISPSLGYSKKLKDILDEKVYKKPIAEDGTVSVITNQPYSGPTPFATYTECGGVINASFDVVHAIEYKYNQNYSNNEFCVWTIRNTDRQSFVFYKYPSEFERETDFIQIHTFTKERYSEPHQSYTMGLVTAPEEITLTGAVAVLVFASAGWYEHRGFRVMINTIGGSPYGYVYRDQFSSSTSGSMDLEPYYDNMMSTFVISPRSSRSLIMTYNTERGVDTFSIFKLENQRRNKVTAGFIDRISGNDFAYYRTCDANAAFLIIFTSDSSTVLDGVAMAW